MKHADYIRRTLSDTRMFLLLFLAIKQSGGTTMSERGGPALLYSISRTTIWSSWTQE